MNVSSEKAPTELREEPSSRRGIEEPGSRRGIVAASLVPPVGLGLAWLALITAIDPRGDFSLNDDWAYGLPVRALVESGQIRFTFWQSMTLISQVFWGALFCLPVGFSFDALRVSTLVAGLGGVLALYGLLRLYGAGRGVAFVGALTYAVDPLYLGLSCTFMTDIPFAALLILSVLSLARGLNSGRDREIWLGLALAFVALFIRQLALAVFLGFLVASPLQYGLGRRWLLRSVVPVLVAGLSLSAFIRMLTVAGRLPGMFYLKADTLKDMIRDLLHLHPGALKPAMLATLIMMLFAGLMAAPWLALLGTSLVARGSQAARRARLAWVIGVTIAATAALAATENLMPMTGNIIGNFKMGILALNGSLPAPPPRAFWIAVTAVASAGMSVLLLILFDLIPLIVARRPDAGTANRRCHAVFLITTGVLYFGPLGLPYQQMLDRYVLSIESLLMALALLVPGVALRRPSAVSWITSLLLVTALGGYSVATIHDYFAWQRTRWAACTALMENQKVSPDDIDGGFEFNNQLPNWNGIYTTSVNADLIPAHIVRRYTVSFSELPGHEVIERQACGTWLPYSPHEILTLHRTDGAPRVQREGLQRGSGH